MDAASMIDLSLDGRTLHITLNRPKVHNAFNRQLVRELTTAFLDLKRRDDVRLVVLTGSGKSFCAGADLAAIKETASRGYDFNLIDGQAIFDLMMAVDNCPLPVVGRINGPAFGGGIGLISCCDIVVSAREAVFGFSEVRIGLIPAVISPFIIAKIGESRARELFLTGERFGADYGHDIGLVHHVVESDDLDNKVAKVVAQLYAAAPNAQKDAKRLITGVRGKSKADTRGFTTDLFARRWNHQ
jgi:methylglutaconyl-CoA hydratase